MESLAPKQKYAALLTALGKSVDEVIHEADVSRPTLYQWRKQQPFKDEIIRQEKLFAATVRESVAHKVIQHFDTHADVAANTITRLASSADSETIQLKAAESTLDRGSAGIIARGSKLGQGNASSIAMPALDQHFLAALMQAAIDTGAQEILASVAVTIQAGQQLQPEMREGTPRLPGSDT